MNRNSIIAILILSIFLSFSNSGWCSEIIYPRNATTAIVKAGDNFTIWYDADSKEKIKSVLLKGPYHTVSIQSIKTKKGSWVYDGVSKGTYNRKITVSIPINTPLERYDLIVMSSKGEVVSHKAVKVIKTYKTEYSIFHISDTHLADESIRAKNGVPKRLPYLSALVDVSNIIGSELVFVTGNVVNSRSWDDGNVNYLSTWPSNQERVDYYYKGSPENNLNGVHDFSAATFTVNGNHDYYERPEANVDKKSKVGFWNMYHGLRMPHFAYGDTRFMALSDDFGEPMDVQGQWHNDWLEKVGYGNLRVIYKHKYEPIPQEWTIDKDIQLGLCGHNHHRGVENPFRRGNTDMYIANFTEYTTFNLIKVKADGRYDVENNLIAIENPKDDPALFKPKLTLDYEKANDGTSASNSATLVNKFEISFPSAKVRFVMPKGHYYTIDKGAIEQQFDGDDFTIVDVRIRLKENSKTKISIKKTNIPKPTLSNVGYGDHERHVIDFWKAKSDRPTPLVFVVHGGSWKTGGKERISSYVDVKKLLKAGISIAAINYRYISQAPKSEIDPPIKTPLYDAARALQFVRSKAKEWDIDKTRIAASGGSAGGCTSLWLAFHDDLAELKSKDPISRESTRLFCAAVIGAQTTLDPKRMKAWIPNSNYGAHAFGKPTFDDFLSERDEVLPWINRYSPYELVSKNDPPVLLVYNTLPAVGVIQKDPTHSANFGVKLQEKCESRGVDCELVHDTNTKASMTVTDYLIRKLKK